MMKHFADLGFDQMSIEPVVGAEDEPYAIRKEDLPKIMEEYDKLAVEYIKRKKEGRGFNFFHFMIDLNQGPCVAKRLSGCGSGTEYLAVTPWGDFYPCHQFVGQEDFLMGNVDTGITRTDIRVSSSSATSTQKKSAETALQDSTAVAAAQPIPTTSTEPLPMLMRSDARCRKSVSSVRS